VNKEKILIVDDDDGIRSQLRWGLNDSFEILEAESGKKALDLAFEHKPSVITLDISLGPREGDAEGLDLIEQFRTDNPFAKIIMITGHGQQENALRAIREGAWDFFHKPIDLDQLKIIIERAVHMCRLERENDRLTQELSQAKRYDEIIGDSDQMVAVYDVIRTVSESDYTVLITGESGTGKELVAKAIHRSSPRRDRAFVTINCGAIPENLLESELFGHEKGAFTDAHIQKQGKFELADKGTIFLDEIGEISPHLQVKLLRALENRTIERVGGRQQINLDVRILAATNRDLMKEVQEGNFREDLYYRLSVITIDLPPLREREDDIVLLASAFLNRYGKENNKSPLAFTDNAVRALLVYPWPGNVRELENKIKRAVIMTKDSQIQPQDLQIPAISSGKERIPSLQEVREKAEREALQDALSRHKWNISRVSRELNTSRTTLYDLIDKYGLKK
jgi:two-component system NtrC family response regulator